MRKVKVYEALMDFNILLNRQTLYVELDLVANFSLIEETTEWRREILESNYRASVHAVILIPNPAGLITVQMQNNLPRFCNAAEKVLSDEGYEQHQRRH